MEEEQKQEQHTEENTLEVLQKERDEYLEGWKRAKADFINYKKEEAERVGRSMRNVTEMIVGDLLPVLDSFELGITSATEDASKKGMELIRMQLEEVLRRYGVEKIKVLHGDLFNPAFHEAIGEIDSEFPEGTIAEEVVKGFMIGERVLRPTRVKVSKNKK